MSDERLTGIGELVEFTGDPLDRELLEKQYRRAKKDSKKKFGNDGDFVPRI